MMSSMDVVGQMEADRDATRARPRVALGFSVLPGAFEQRTVTGVDGPVRVRRPRPLRGLRGRRESAGARRPLGVNRPAAGIRFPGRSASKPSNVCCDIAGLPGIRSSRESPGQAG